MPLWMLVPALSLYANIHHVVAVTPPLVLLWVSYFWLLVILTEMMPPKLNSRCAARPRVRLA